MFHGLRIPSGRWRSSFPEVSRERDSEKRRQISLRRLRRGNNHSCRCIFFFFFSYRGGDACDEYKKWRRRGRRRKRRALEFPSSFFLSFFLSFSLSLSLGRCFESVIYDEKGEEEEEEEEEEQKRVKKSHKKHHSSRLRARTHVEIKSQNGHTWSRSRNNTKTMGGARRSHSNTSSSRVMTPSLSKREC